MPKYTCKKAGVRLVEIGAGHLPDAQCTLSEVYWSGGLSVCSMSICRIIYPLLFCFQIFSGVTMSQPMHIPYLFQVLDCDGDPIPKAQVLMNGQLAHYDSSTGTHSLESTQVSSIDLEVSAAGFRSAQQKGMPADQRPTKIYLIREGKPWYPDVNGWPVAYSSRPRDLLVALKRKAEPSGKATLADLETELLALAELTGYTVLEVGWDAGLPPAERNRTTDLRMVLRAPEDVGARGLASLAALRAHPAVAFAGPLIVHGEDYAHATTVGASIAVRPSPNMKNYAEGESLAAQWGCRYDVPNGKMIFQADAGTVVIEAAKAMAASGLFSVVELEFYKPLALDD